MVDKVLPLKIENPASGGTETDDMPVEVNPSEDYVAAKGVALRGSGSGDTVLQTALTGSSDSTITLPAEDGTVALQHSIIYNYINL